MGCGSIMSTLKLHTLSNPPILHFSFSFSFSFSSSSYSFPLPRRKREPHHSSPKQRTVIHASISLPHRPNNFTLSPQIGNNVQLPNANANANPSSSLTPLNFLETAAAVYGDCPSIIYNNVTRTWSQTYIRCLKLASSIAALGINRRDVVSVVAPNIPAMCELHFAVPMAGAVLNTLNLRLDANAVSNLLQHSESKLVFVDVQSASLVCEAVSMLPAHPILVLIEDDDCEECCSSDDVGCKFDYNYETMVEKGDEPAFEWIRPESEWDPIVLNYTSGTTAAPKGVVQSHRSTFLQTVNCLLEWRVPQRPVYLWTVPMFHCNGWNFAWGIAAVGGTNVCLRRVDAASVYGALEEHGVTHLCGAPTVLNILINYTGSKALVAPVNVMTGGAPPPAAVLDRAELLGFIVIHVYGLTETGGPVVMCKWKQEWDKFSEPERAKLKARQGVGSLCCPDVDVVNPDSGESVRRDGLTMGEVVLRGSTMMLGYLKDSEATSMCMRENGWFWTGDIGVMHADGYLEVKDRSKDVIICGGENVSSVEVEAVLYRHPAVYEAAVVARPDRFWGETPCAFVRLKEGAAEKPSAKEIRDFCKERLPLFMVPRLVLFKEKLPKTSTGKIQKFLLRDMAKDIQKF